MDFNYNKLKGKITEKYGTQLSFARAMGVSERTLSLKLNNRVAFSQPEIFLASQLLGINMSAA